MNKRLKVHDLVSFFTVRHPFERLVSAYEHKVLRKHAKYLGNISFEQFLNNYVIREANHCPTTHQCMNRHWMPYISSCSYCNTKYTVIQKMETFDQDRRAILEMVGLEHLGKNEKKKHLNMRHSNTSSSDLTKAYFDNLPRDLVKSIFNIYKYDFESFGYLCGTDMEDWIYGQASQSSSYYSFEIRLLILVYVFIMH